LRCRRGQTREGWGEMGVAGPRRNCVADKRRGCGFHQKPWETAGKTMKRAQSHAWRLGYGVGAPAYLPEVAERGA